MFDASDEALGLPPLHEVTPEDSMMVLATAHGMEGLVTLNDRESPLPVRYLSVRGLMVDTEGDSEDGQEELVAVQLHLAFPHDTLRQIAQGWLDVLDAEEQGTFPQDEALPGLDTFEEPEGD